jgi:DNA polymerase I-like protein with 3'-5' exonuclease and polymerase domains
VALARSYGMGKQRMSEQYDIPLPECDVILAAFDAVVPYVSLQSRAVNAKAREKGFIRTLVGHKRHFNLWEVPKDHRDDPAESYAPLPLEEAKNRWPDYPLERASTHKGYNALIQGGAAGQTKKALVEVNKAVGLPLMTVHDEISKSVQRPKETALMNEILVNCIPLLAPVRADLSVDTSWQ